MNAPDDPFGIASRPVMLSSRLPLNRHQPLRLAGAIGVVMQVLVPTMYSTVLVVELPATSVAATLKVCRPCDMSSGTDPWTIVQLAVPEYAYASSHEYDG